MTTSTAVTQETLVGRVKWFNSSSGFGFITLTEDSSLGASKGTDIFVHHNSITVAKDQYRYLVQGEYVELSIESPTSGSHKYQAVDVSGIKGGLLMCETRNDVKSERNKYYDTKQSDSPSVVKTEGTKNNDTNSRKRNASNSQPKVRGEGPREGGEWTYVVKSNRPKQEEATSSKPANSRPPRSNKAKQEEN
jgi:cold shock CspA family protein